MVNWSLPVTPNISGPEKCFPVPPEEQLWWKNLVVYWKKPFAGPEQVLGYLGRYTHRGAISNHRIADGAHAEVTFRYRDRKDEDKLKEMTLSAQEFIRRFLLYVLPDGFMRIRHA
jgi:hypothetical protein